MDPVQKTAKRVVGEKRCQEARKKSGLGWDTWTSGSTSGHWQPPSSAAEDPGGDSCEKRKRSGSREEKEEKDGKEEKDEKEKDSESD